MKVLGIGNAIVDVICKVEENFIKKNNLTKGTMKLIFDEVEFKNILVNLKIEKTVSGGSVANSIVGLSQLKNDVGFIGKVSDDIFGAKYEEGLKKENVKYFSTALFILATNRQALLSCQVKHALRSVRTRPYVDLKSAQMDRLQTGLQQLPTLAQIMVR